MRGSGLFVLENLLPFPPCFPGSLSLACVAVPGLEPAPPPPAESLSPVLLSTSLLFKVFAVCGREARTGMRDGERGLIAAGLTLLLRPWAAALSKGATSTLVLGSREAAASAPCLAEGMTSTLTSSPSSYPPPPGRLGGGLLLAWAAWW